MNTKPYFVCHPGTFDSNHETGEQSWSPELRELLGVDDHVPSDVSTLVKCVHPADRRRIIALMTRSLRSGGEPRVNFEHRIVRPDGEVRWVYVSVFTVFRRQAAIPICSVGTVTDITEQKDAESIAEALWD